MINIFLEDLLNRRGPARQGHNTPRLDIELAGGNIVESFAFEPDPKTYRDEYYYNASTNVLYRKIIVENNPNTGSIVAYWKPVSNPPVGQ